MTDQTSTAPSPCPRCSGPWLRDLLFQHRTTCPRYASELGPREADHRRPWQRALRQATDTEVAVIGELGYEPLSPGESYLIAPETRPLYTRRVLIEDSTGNIHEAKSPYILTRAEEREREEENTNVT